MVCVAAVGGGGGTRTCSATRASSAASRSATPLAFGVALRCSSVPVCSSQFSRAFAWLPRPGLPRPGLSHPGLSLAFALSRATSSASAVSSSCHSPPVRPPGFKERYDCALQILSEIVYRNPLDRYHLLALLKLPLALLKHRFAGGLQRSLAADVLLAPRNLHQRRL